MQIKDPGRWPSPNSALETPTLISSLPKGITMKLLKPSLAFSAAALSATAMFVGYLAPTVLGLTEGAHAAAAAKLGSLAPFKTIVTDVATLVNKGDLVAARKRVTDLESAWDGAEAGIKPRSATDWHLVDKSLDKLYSAIRATKPDVAACKLALSDALSNMDKAEGK
jgi:hypothetical protein